MLINILCLSLLLLKSILFYIVYMNDSALLQCRMGLISEVIMIGIYSDEHRQSYAPVSVTFFTILSSHFFPKLFCACQ